jgi:hypothetical protein
MKQPKPFFRTQTRSWYVQLGKRQFNLGSDKASAWATYHKLMADRPTRAAQPTTVAELFELYLEWCFHRRSAGTYQNNKRYLKSFLAHIGKRFPIRNLKPHHVTDWINEHVDWTPTTQHDAISIVQRPFNWALKIGRLDWMLRRLKIGEWTVPGALRFTTLRSLAKLNDLESLELHGLGLKSSEYRHLAGLVNLRNLRIEQSVLDDSAMKEIGKLRGLQLLTFNSGGVTDVGLEHLKSLTNLETLMFDLTNIQGPGLIHLYELKRLRYVLAAGCSDESKESLRKALPHCRVD